MVCSYKDKLDRTFVIIGPCGEIDEIKQEWEQMKGEIGTMSNELKNVFKVVFGK